MCVCMCKPTVGVIFFLDAGRFVLGFHFNVPFCRRTHSEREGEGEERGRRPLSLGVSVRPTVLPWLCTFFLLDQVPLDDLPDVFLRPAPDDTTTFAILKIPAHTHSHTHIHPSIHVCGRLLVRFLLSLLLSKCDPPLSRELLVEHAIVLVFWGRLRFCCSTTEAGQSTTHTHTHTHTHTPPRLYLQRHPCLCVCVCEGGREGGCTSDRAA